MLIGITCDSGEKVEPYLRALRELGVPYTVLTPEKAHTIAGLTGLLVPGGGKDVDPALYDQRPHPETSGPPDLARDRMEVQLITDALAANLPLLCICRGMQIFNVVRGGTLNQHIPEHKLHRVKPPPDRRHEPVHTVLIQPGTKLAEILGPVEHPVNSRHHQAVDQVGKGLIASALAPDGVIEAVEDPAQPFALGCQWHPEESVLTNPGDRKILEAFRAVAQVTSEVRETG